MIVELVALFSFCAAFLSFFAISETVLPEVTKSRISQLFLSPQASSKNASDRVSLAIFRLSIDTFSSSFMRREKLMRTFFLVSAFTLFWHILTFYLYFGHETWWAGAEGNRDSLVTAATNTRALPFWLVSLLISTSFNFLSFYQTTQYLRVIARLRSEANFWLFFFGDLVLSLIIGAIGLAVVFWAHLMLMDLQGLGNAHVKITEISIEAKSDESVVYAQFVEKRAFSNEIVISRAGGYQTIADFRQYFESTPTSNFTFASADCSKGSFGEMEPAIIDGNVTRVRAECFSIGVERPFQHINVREKLSRIFSSVLSDAQSVSWRPTTPNVSGATIFGAERPAEYLYSGGNLWTEEYRVWQEDFFSDIIYSAEIDWFGGPLEFPKNGFILSSFSAAMFVYGLFIGLIVLLRTRQFFARFLMSKVFHDEDKQLEAIAYPVTKSGFVACALVLAVFFAFKLVTSFVQWILI